MAKRKQNISRWYMLGLAAILTAGCMLVSVGTAYARYRLDSERLIFFSSKTPVQVALGVGMNENFEHTDQFGWEPVRLTESEGETTTTREVYQMTFTMSNYQDLVGYDSEDILVRVRLVASQEAWNGNGTLVLSDGVLLEDGTPRQVPATVTPIGEDTKLYHTFGMGWVFQFLDEYGRELTWTLKGGELSCVELQLTMDAAAVTGTSLLQLQVEGVRAE